jgi:hypothetical protein
MFAQDVEARQIPRSLRVSTKSVYKWRRVWRADGDTALALKRPGGSACKLDTISWRGWARRSMPSWPPAAGARISGGRWPGSPR